MLHSSSLRLAAVFSAAGLLLAGCGLGDVGPDLDAWRAAQADSTGDLAAAEDADAGEADTQAGDATEPDAADADTADPDAATGSDSDVALPECTTATACDDGDPCSLDTCDAAGTCQHGPVDCDDGNGCTVDSCTVAAGGCDHPSSSEPCDDGTPCTTGDKCADGKCQGVALQVEVDFAAQGLASWQAVAALEDGGAILAGTREAVGVEDPEAAWVVRLDETGQVTGQWLATAPGKDVFADVAILPGGDVLLVGERNVAGQGGAWLTRRTPDLQQSVLDLQLGGKDGDRLVALRLLPGGDWLVGGESSIDDKDHGYLARLDPQGGLVWEQVVAAGGQQLQVLDVERIGEGFGLVGVIGNETGWLLRTNANGNALGEHTFSASGAAFAQLETAARMPDGGLLLAGLASTPEPSAEVWTVRTDAAGKVLWNLVEQAAGVNGAAAVQVLADGRIVLAGFRPGPLGLPRAAVWQIDGNGGVAWSEDFGPVGAVLDIAVAPGGGFWLAGQGGKSTKDYTARAWRTDDWGHPTCEPTSLCAGKIAADCADTDVCSHDVCDPQTGCKHPQNQAPCDDGKPCTAGESCAAGTCQGGAPTDCDDINACTADSCDPGQGCLHVAVAPGTACVDGDACTTFDTCEAKACKGQAFLPCDDGNPCTQDGCDAKTGCTHVNLADLAPCADSQLCLAGQCKPPWATAVSVGNTFACALRWDTTVACWGGNQFGELGAASLPASATPVQVPGLIGITQLEVGAVHGCAFSKFSDAVFCWGNNELGQIGGVGPKAASAEPSVVPLPAAVTAISVGGAHSCALQVDGSARCWGYNGFGQIDGKGGIGLEADGILTPTVAPGLGSALLVAAGGSTSCGVQVSDQALWCWGGYSGIWAGNPALDKTFAKVQGLPAGMAAISLGANHGCGVDGAGAVWCWGQAGEKLGHGVPTAGDVAPAKVAWAEKAKAVAVGAEYSCALTEQGGVWCWGAHDAGQLGIGGTLPAKALPGDTGLQGVVSLAAFDTFTCAVRFDGSVHCWGTGALGTGAQSSSVPVTVVGSQFQ